MPDVHATVTASVLNVRRAASASAAKVGELRRGARVDVVGREREWYHVAADALDGWVHGDYVALDATPTADGFLCHDDALCDCALAPPAARRIASPVGGSASTAAARTWNRYGGMLAPLSAATRIAPAAAVGVLCVESSGQGMADDGRLVIRFENHVFWNTWGKRQPEVFRRHFTFADAKRWTGHRYRTGPGEPWRTGHRGQAAEWEAFTIARALHEPAAMQSISMGASQVMGFNHAAIGYDSAREMFDRFAADERYHVLGLFDFIKGAGRTSPMLEALRREDYERFATHYNGTGQAAVYGARIRTAVAAFERIAPA